MQTDSWTSCSDQGELEAAGAVIGACVCGGSCLYVHASSPAPRLEEGITDPLNRNALRRGCEVAL